MASPALSSRFLRHAIHVPMISTRSPYRNACALNTDPIRYFMQIIPAMTANRTPQSSFSLRPVFLRSGRMPVTR